MGRDFGYTRASTRKQEASPETQRRLIAEYATNRGIASDLIWWFNDPATTGKIPLSKRAGGGAMTAELRHGDTVWIAKIDRAFRSFKDFVITLDKWAKAGINIKLADLRGDFDLDSPQGKAFLRIFAVFAEYEREIISQRTREGLANCKRNGQANGKYAGYGFKWEVRTVVEGGDRKRRKFKVPDHEERRVMGHIAAWRLGGYDYEAITHHLASQGILTNEGKPWTLSRVRRAYLAELQLQQDDMKAGVQ